MAVKQRSEFVRCNGCGAQVSGFGPLTPETEEMRIWCRECISIREAMTTFPYSGPQSFPDRRNAVIQE